MGGMGSSELWAVKRILKDVLSFSVRRYQEEVKNLRALSKASFIHTCLLLN